MRRAVIGSIFAFALAIGGAAFAWLWFAGGSGEPSTELTTPAIVRADGLQSFVITPGGGSIASFVIDEELRGSPQRVVGTTGEVAGQVRVDLSDVTTVQLSEIVVSARTFRTNSERRDRAVRGPVILNSASDEFEFITFVSTTTAVSPGSFSPGETIEFTVVGNMTIRGVTGEATFDVFATLVDAKTIEGTAFSRALRSDFGIGIPNVPGVANVSDEVILTFDFVAVSG